MAVCSTVALCGCLGASAFRGNARIGESDPGPEPCDRCGITAAALAAEARLLIATDYAS